MEVGLVNRISAVKRILGDLQPLLLAMNLQATINPEIPSRGVNDVLAVNERVVLTGQQPTQSTVRLSGYLYPDYDPKYP